MNHVLTEIVLPVLAKFKGKLGVDDVVRRRRRGRRRRGVLRVSFSLGRGLSWSMFVHPPAWGGLRFALVILVVDLRPPFFPCIHPSTRPTQSNRHDRTTTEGTLKRCYGLWQSRQLKDDVHGAGALPRPRARLD